MIIKTDRLFIRPIGTKDAPFILKVMNTKEWIRYIGDRNVHTVQDAENYIVEKMLPQFVQKGYGNCMVFLKDTQEPVGTCGLYCRKGLRGADIGFATIPKYYRKGYTLEASKAVLDYAVNVLGIDPLQGIVDPSHTASQSLLKKLGMIYVDTRILPGMEDPVMYFRL